MEDTYNYNNGVLYYGLYKLAESKIGTRGIDSFKCISISNYINSCFSFNDKLQKGKKSKKRKNDN